MMTLSTFKRMNKQGNVLPIAIAMPSDLETPVSVFHKLAAGKKYSFLLESIEGGEKLARYSFIGVDPFLVVEAKGKVVTLRKGKKTTQIEADPLEFMKELLSVYRPVHFEDLPRFTGGAVGYFSFDTVRWSEHLPTSKPDKIGMPEMIFGLYQTIVAFDHLKQEMILIGNVLHENGEPGLATKVHKTIRQMIRTIDSLQKFTRGPKRSPSATRSRTKCLTSRPQFESSVRKAKKYIKEGDIFQVVLSRRWQIASSAEPLEVYRQLRRTNPSPYMFLLNFDENAVIGSSPEMMVRVEQGNIETRPIAGTRPRGKDEAEDAKRIKNLLSDQKELAEHTMLLDLGRNDIGRVSRPGTVQVRERMTIEKYSHVIHIVSSVVGKLKPRTAALDGHFACFPAGTVSGAPKVRAMEIINELETTKRGIYAGSIAYVDFWGNLDSCIAIRTVVKKGKSYFVQAGAGIVADSVPRKESKETEAKARVIIEAVTGKKFK
ncbi:MAG: anthranilate synthase component I [bacterium]|nr:anthranilate synthase component I [bacterium]